MKKYCHFVVEPLTKSEELGLAKKAAGGDKQARETLIRANIKYALSYAKTFYGHGLSNEDVDDEAVIGLIKAVDHFDYSKGTKIITLAWNIAGAITCVHDFVHNVDFCKCDDFCTFGIVEVVNSLY